MADHDRKVTDTFARTAGVPYSGSHLREEELKGLDFLFNCRYNLKRMTLVPNKSAKLVSSGEDI